MRHLLYSTAIACASCVSVTRSLLEGQSTAQPVLEERRRPRGLLLQGGQLPPRVVDRSWALGQFLVLRYRLYSALVADERPYAHPTICTGCALLGIERASPRSLPRRGIASISALDITMVEKLVLVGPGLTAFSSAKTGTWMDSSVPGPRAIRLACTARARALHGPRSRQRARLGLRALSVRNAHCGAPAASASCNLRRLDVRRAPAPTLAYSARSEPGHQAITAR